MASGASVAQGIDPRTPARAAPAATRQSTASAIGAWTIGARTPYLAHKARASAGQTISCSAMAACSLDQNRFLRQQDVHFRHLCRSHLLKHHQLAFILVHRNCKPAEMRAMLSEIAELVP